MLKVILLLSLLMFVACNEVSKTVIKYPSKMHKQLAENKNLWEKYNIQNYSFVVQRSCFCPHEENRQITIRNRKVSEAKYIPSNTPIPNKTQVKMIDDYFDMIENALAKNAAKITVKYDKLYGLPTEIAIDYRAQIADDEIYYSITHFNIHIAAGSISCTEQYLPVCAKVALHCLTIPCEAVEETFSNQCYLNLNPNASYLRDGEC